MKQMPFLMKLGMRNSHREKGELKKRKVKLKEKIVKFTCPVVKLSWRKVKPASPPRLNIGCRAFRLQRKAKKTPNNTFY